MDGWLYNMSDNTSPDRSDASELLPVPGSSLSLERGLSEMSLPVKRDRSSPLPSRESEESKGDKPGLTDPRLVVYPRYREPDPEVKLEDALRASAESERKLRSLRSQHDLMERLHREVKRRLKDEARRQASLREEVESERDELARALLRMSEDNQNLRDHVRLLTDIIEQLRRA